MDKMDGAQIIAVAEPIVERVIKDYSKQGRWADDGKSFADQFYQSIYAWYKLAMDEIKQPTYQTDSRQRDEWLREFWKKEPHWCGAINQCVLVDSARPWTITGGERQVRQYANILHDANWGKGWRHFFRQSSLSYRVTDMGCITELGRDGVFGPLRALYHVDSARCRWSGKKYWPLYRYPGNRARMQKWRETDFFNVCSLPNDDEKFLGLGWCATSRAFELIKVLYGVMMHDQESVGAKMMKGLLLLNGIEQSQWDDAMEGRKAQMSELERKYFGGVFILASLGAGDVDAKLVPLSQLPENFDRQVFLDQTMFGYSLILGYDAREFWPVSSGALGTARETEQQHLKAATKGALEFPHAWQEKFQSELPETVHFEFEARDTDAEMMEAQMAETWVQVARDLYDMDKAGNEGLVDKEQALSLLVNHGIVPGEWTESIQEAQVVSDHQYRIQRAMEMPEVRRFVELHPGENVVQYRWSPMGTSERILDISRKSF